MKAQTYFMLESEVDKLLANIGCDVLKTIEDLASWEGDRAIGCDFYQSSSFLNNRMFIDENNHAVDNYTDEELLAMRDDPRSYFHEDLVDDLTHIISLLSYLYYEIKTETQAKSKAFDMIRGIVNEVDE